jgi:hypothetical protein
MPVTVRLEPEIYEGLKRFHRGGRYERGYGKLERPAVKAV